MEHTVAIDAGVVHHDVQRSELLNGKGHEALNLLLIGDVDLIEHGRTALGSDFRNGLVGGQHVRQHNLGALFCQLLGDALAQPAAGACHNRNFSFESHSTFLLMKYKEL